MTWKSFHRRGEILRTVIETADRRRDGLLPMDVDGVVETFGDEMSLLGALQLRWHTRLAGRIERELMDQPMDLERAVVAAWQGTAEEMPGVRAVVDHYRAEPLDARMAEMMARATAKEHVLLAVMAGRVSAQDATAVRVGETIEHEARATRRPTSGPAEPAAPGLLDRIKAALAA
ncbi:hypothetical protein ACT8ZV_12580 [Nocardioides sp. MAHUQ-72]|uniref:hypothetical protein n=1 Tax=unclassified Nocardioides TaxID=2615069 RepID=UPI003608F069